jgi:sugar lactone lactonase YvrE
MTPVLSPRGITTDNNNNIYVVGGRSDNVVVISPDGQNYKALLLNIVPKIK